jgi:hypothetical protein
VAQIPDTPLRLVEQLVFASLQAFVAPRPLLLARLHLLDARHLLVAVLDCRLGSAATDENGLVPISGRDQRVHPRIDTDQGASDGAPAFIPISDRSGLEPAASR